MSRLIAGLLIGAATMGGIYAAAAITATSMAASFTTTETTSHSRIVEFEAAARRASDEHRAARAKCRRLAGTNRILCIAEARAQEKRPVSRDDRVKEARS